MFKIGIIGCGVVGSGVADILIEKAEKLSEIYKTKVTLAKILDIKDLSASPYGLYATKEPDDILLDESIKLVVMAMGGDRLAYEWSKEALLRKKHLVTSNKEIVAAYGRELITLAHANGVRFMYEASAGGGIPIIRPLNICLKANDIYEIQGILNGTTNYILTKMIRDKMSFEDALALAQEKGYAEADPSADVDGYDAARKIAILSSIAYDAFVDYKDVSCKGIRDIGYEDLDLSHRLGYTIKLIGRSILKEGKIRVGVEPLLIRKDHILAEVNSVFNGVLVKSNYLGDSMYYGRGAGKLPTASAILGDIVEILSGAKEVSLPAFVNREAEIDKEASEDARFFVRFHKGKIDCMEASEIVKRVFGQVALFCGGSDEGGQGAFITGYIQEDTLKDMLASLVKLIDMDILNTIKVED